MHSSRHSQLHGGTMVAVLMVVVAISTLVAVTVRFSTHSNRLAARQREVMNSLAAADGALEYAYAVWKDVVRANGMRAPTTTQLTADQRFQNLRAINNAGASPAAELAGTSNSFTDFVIGASDPWGTAATDPNGTAFYSVPVDSYPGWKGHAYFYKASVKASGLGTAGTSGRPSATVSRYFSLTNVPLFQAAIFYMDNL